MNAAVSSYARRHNVSIEQAQVAVYGEETAESNLLETYNHLARLTDAAQTGQDVADLYAEIEEKWESQPEELRRELLERIQ